MRTPYVAHIFGDEVKRKLRSRSGWVTAGVASSIAWPKFDVCVSYAGDEYYLRGTELDGKPSPPGISIQCPGGDVDGVLAKIYRFTSILGWFLDGYVDVSGHVSGSHAFLYGDPRKVFSSLGIAGVKSFNCNHMPIVDDDNVRKALAFYREGCRLTDVHNGYAFLSFYKVIESQFDKASKKVEWITENLNGLTERAAERVAELRSAGVDVSRHLFESGRCAVAHASMDGEIVDPDIPADKKRLSADLVVITQLARKYIRDELKVPTSRSLYEHRNRLAPWEALLTEAVLGELRSGNVSIDLEPLNGLAVALRLWPDGVVPGLGQMRMLVDAVGEGVVKVALINDRETVLLFFYLDFKNGRIHQNLEEGGLVQGGSNLVNEEDVRAYSTYFYQALGNGIVELAHGELEPIDCEVIIPVNIIPPNPEAAISEAVEKFRAEKASEPEKDVS